MSVVCYKKKLLHKGNSLKINTYKTPQLNKYSNIGQKSNTNQEEKQGFCRGKTPFLFVRIFFTLISPFANISKK